MESKLRFVNRSNDSNNTEVVIFQKNEVANIAEIAVAWKRIVNCGHDCYHPFVFSTDLKLSIGDDNGNFSPRKKALAGGIYLVKTDRFGKTVSYRAQEGNTAEIQVMNCNQIGAFNVNIFRNDKLLDLKTAVVPQQKAVFRFVPTIWIGAASQIVEGQVFDSAILSSINTEISLVGVMSADIVMTGGGNGPQAKKLSFELVNAVYC